MPLVNGNIPSLINGVSQQPATVRLPSQGAAQVNGRSSPAQGLGKRAPTNHIVRMLADADPDAHVHFIKRDETEQYAVVVQDDNISAFSLLTGEKIPVLGTQRDRSYLTRGQARPRSDLRAVTIADSTFYINRKVKTKLAPDVTPGSTYGAYSVMFWVRAGGYNTTFTARVGDNTFEYTTPAGQKDDAFKALPDYIADRIAKGLKSVLPGENWTVRYRKGDAVVWVYAKDGSAFGADFKDSNANANTVLITDRVARFDLLPSIAPNDFLTRVVGDVASNADDYWVRFEVEDGAEFGRGTWKEAAAPDLPDRFDHASMPHLLRRLYDSDGSAIGGGGGVYFQFEEITTQLDGIGWRPRQVGDETTNKPPSFVGQAIHEIFVFKNRLGFIAGTNVVLSRSGDYFDFWRFTALSVQDDDPIDVDTARERVAGVEFAVGFQDELLLFADRAQMSLRGTDILSPKTVSVTTATHYEFDRATAPQPVENVVYFANKRAEYSDVYEYYVDQQSSVKSADNITEHLPRYIPGRLLNLAVSSSAKMLVGNSDTNRNKLYVYSWARNGNQKIMSSWSEWDFGAEAVVLDTTFIEDKLYLVIKRDCGMYLERIDTTALTDENSEYIIHLDRRIRGDLVPDVYTKYDAEADETTIRMPYRPSSSPVAVTADVPGSSWPGGVPVPVVRSYSCDQTVTPPEPPTPPTPELPCIKVVAAAPEAIEGGGPGVFQFFRTGDISATLSVNVAYSGTATLTSDYTLTPSGTTITFPANSNSVTVTVNAVDDVSLEGPETVVVTIQPNVGVYEVCQPATAIVAITDDNDIPTCTSAGLDPSKALTIRLFNIVNPGLIHLGFTPPGNPAERYVEWTAALQNWTVTLDPNWNLSDHSFAVVGSSTTLYGPDMVPNPDSPGEVRVVINPQFSSGEWKVRVYVEGTALGVANPLIFLTDAPHVNQTCTAVPNHYEEVEVSGDENIGYDGYVIAMQEEDGDPVLTLPAAPSSLTATAVSSSKIDLAWTDNSDNETGFFVERSDDGGSTWFQIGSTPGNVHVYSNVNLRSATQYKYRVKAINSVGSSAYSNVATATTQGTINPQPTFVTKYSTGEVANPVKCGYIDLNWTVDGASAFLHHRPTAPTVWKENGDTFRWISYTVDTSAINESPTVRQYRTTVDIGGGVNPTTVTLFGEVVVAGTLQSVKVNGVSAGVTANSATNWTAFSLTGNAFQQGLNTITFTVQSPNNAPSGLMVRWNASQTVSGLAQRVPYSEPTVDDVSLDTALRAADVSTANTEDPCACTHKVVLKGRWLSTPIWIGESYEFRYQLSPIYLRTQSSEGGSVAVTGSRLQITTAAVSFDRTGVFQVEVLPRAGQKSTYFYSGRTVGSAPAAVGQVPVNSGMYQFLIMAKNDEVDVSLVNGGFLPSWFQTIDWLGRIEPKARRV